MTCRADAAHGVPQDWSVEDVVIDPAPAGETLVQWNHASRCHRAGRVLIGGIAPPPEANTRGVIVRAS